MSLINFVRCRYRAVLLCTVTAHLAMTGTDYLNQLFRAVYSTCMMHEIRHKNKTD